MTAPVTEPEILVRLDLRNSGTYVTVECQLGAHHGCPGGLHHEGGRIDLRCHCDSTECECQRRRGK